MIRTALKHTASVAAVMCQIEMARAATEKPYRCPWWIRWLPSWRRRWERREWDRYKERVRCYQKAACLYAAAAVTGWKALEQ